MIQIGEVDAGNTTAAAGTRSAGFEVRCHLPPELLMSSAVPASDRRSSLCFVLLVGNRLAGCASLVTRRRIAIVKAVTARAKSLRHVDLTCMELASQVAYG